MTLSLVGGLSNILQGSLVIYLLWIVLNLNIQMAANININIVITVIEKRHHICCLSLVNVHSTRSSR